MSAGGKANDIADRLREVKQLWELRAKRPATQKKEKKVGRRQGCGVVGRRRWESERSGMVLDK